MPRPKNGNTTHRKAKRPEELATPAGPHERSRTGYYSLKRPVLAKHRAREASPQTALPAHDADFGEVLTPTLRRASIAGLFIDSLEAPPAHAVIMRDVKKYEGRQTWSA